MRTVLRSKVQEIRVTAANIEYEGSLTLDEDIMDAMCVIPYEQVFINSKNGNGRIMTYLLPGERGSKCCEMNGGAANHFAVGEIVHLLVFETIGPNGIADPIIIHIDD